MQVTFVFGGFPVSSKTEPIDIVALEATLKTALTGAKPFTLGPTDDWRRAVLAGAFTPLSKHLPDSPQRWQTFFARCFAVEKADVQLHPASFS
jgi:hypothetical protein